MKIKYHPEIDGLRAIAVDTVIFYHAQITIFGHQPFKGGFIGVDIFFVISGYLITSIILKELVTTGSFSFKHFYERRIRRILPALLFVMLVSLPFAWMYLLPSSFVDFSKSILYSLGFSSNFYFHYSGQQYGAESGLLKPFLHTWSLSVEEQFYILFPIVLLITFKYFKKHLLTILVIGLIISLQMADWGSKNYPSASFYFLHARMWELLAGSILAYFEITLGHRSKNKILNLILPTIGLFLIGHSILFFNDKTFHPSFYTLSPIIGVCLIIWFSSKNELITKILSTKLFVGVGLISYSLYLWHYPIFAFARIKDNTPSEYDKFEWVVLSIILSLISYFFIERPFRNNKNKSKFIISLILISISVLVIFNFSTIQKDGYNKRLPEILKTISGKNDYRLKNLDGKICHGSNEGCKFNISSNKKLYFIGDSHIGRLLYDIKDKAVKKKFQLITFTTGGCMYFPGFKKIKIKTLKNQNRCTDHIKILNTILSNENNSIIVIGGRLTLYLSNYYFDNQEGGIEKQKENISGSIKWNKTFVSLGKYKNIQNSFIKEVTKISKKNKIILVYPIPEVGWHVPKKLYKNLPKNVFLVKDYLVPKNFITTSFEVYKKRTKSSFELLDSLQGDNIYRVYPHKLFCDTIIKRRCITHDDKNLFYSDDDHLSLEGSKMVNDLIMNEIEKIELKSN